MKLPVPGFIARLMLKEKIDDAAYIEAAKKEIEAAKRAYRGKICYEKLMERLNDHNRLITARKKREKRAERNRKYLNRTKSRRHIGLIIDQSAFDFEDWDLRDEQLINGFWFIPNGTENFKNNEPA